MIFIEITTTSVYCAVSR